MKKLSTNGSIRRLARQWVDLSDHRRKELLSGLDTESRWMVIERMIEIRTARQRKDKHL